MVLDLLNIYWVRDKPEKFSSQTEDEAFAQMEGAA
jgi:hypothetical protein